MSSVNKVILVGNLGKDPEIHHFEQGRAVARFSVATTENYNDKNGERVSQTEWHNITIWRQGLVGVVEKYLKKGAKVYLEGKLRTRNWTDDNNVTRYATEINVDNLVMLGGNPNSDNQSAPLPPVAKKTANAAPAESFESNDEEDDLPF